MHYFFPLNYNAANISPWFTLYITSTGFIRSEGAFLGHVIHSVKLQEYCLALEILNNLAGQCRGSHCLPQEVPQFITGSSPQWLEAESAISITSASRWNNKYVHPQGSVSTLMRWTKVIRFRRSHGAEARHPGWAPRLPHTLIPFLTFLKQVFMNSVVQTGKEVLVMESFSLRLRWLFTARRRLSRVESGGRPLATSAQAHCGGFSWLLSTTAVGCVGFGSWGTGALEPRLHRCGEDLVALRHAGIFLDQGSRLRP